jgi:hypothetical protein
MLHGQDMSRPDCQQMRFLSFSPVSKKLPLFLKQDSVPLYPIYPLHLSNFIRLYSIYIDSFFSRATAMVAPTPFFGWHGSRRKGAWRQNKKYAILCMQRAPIYEPSRRGSFARFGAVLGGES